MDKICLCFFGTFVHFQILHWNFIYGSHQLYWIYSKRRPLHMVLENFASNRNFYPPSYFQPLIKNLDLESKFQPLFQKVLRTTKNFDGQSNILDLNKNLVFWIENKIFLPKCLTQAQIFNYWLNFVKSREKALNQPNEKINNSFFLFIDGDFRPRALSRISEISDEVDSEISVAHYVHYRHCSTGTVNHVWSVYCNNVMLIVLCHCLECEINLDFTF